MKRTSTWLALSLVLGLVAPASAQDEEGLFGEDNGGIVEENGGVLEDDEAGVIDGVPGAGEEAGDHPSFASDEYGLFDPDYDWEALDDEDFGEWYGEADDDWLNDDAW